MESQATTFGGKTNLGTRASSNNNTEIEDVEDEISDEKQMFGIDRKLGRRNSELNLRDLEGKRFLYGLDNSPPFEDFSLGKMYSEVKKRKEERRKYLQKRRKSDQEALAFCRRIKHQLRRNEQQILESPGKQQLENEIKSVNLPTGKYYKVWWSQLKS